MPKLRTVVSNSPYFRHTSSKARNTRKKQEERVEIAAISGPVDAQKLGWDFYDVPGMDLAKRLLGKVFVRILDNGNRVSGRIIETEAYLGTDDKASHSVLCKKTDRNAAMFMRPGTTYVYMTYGMYFCMNISSQGDGSAVLIRSLEPLEGLDDMRIYRGAKRKDGGTKLKDKELCNGPAKLCQSLKLDKKVADQKDLVTSPLFWIENGESVSEGDIVRAPRIGIGSVVEEWRNKPMRFYIRNNSFVSVRDKEAERTTQA